MIGALPPDRPAGRSGRCAAAGLALRKNLPVILALAVLAGVPFALGKHFELNYPDAFDSASYVCSARHVLSGARIGHEEKPGALTGTLLVNMLGVKLSGFNETGSKWLQALFQGAALALMFSTVRRLFGTLAGFTSVTIAAIYLSAPLIAKSGNVKEQYMIAVMVAGICCFAHYRLGRGGEWAVAAGALLAAAPLFKQTGLSAVAATGAMIMAGPLFHHIGWKKAGRDCLLLAAGATLLLAPLSAWYASMDTPLRYCPYSFVVEPVLTVLQTGENRSAGLPQTRAGSPPDQGEQSGSGLLPALLPGYIRYSWEALSVAERGEAFDRIFRYYRLLILPILLGLGAVLARWVVLLRAGGGKPAAERPDDPGRFVLLFAVWWLLDMAFVWVSPQGYEQYYLPLTASGAMLGAYPAGLYAGKLRAAREKAGWIVAGLAGLAVMTGMLWPIFFGIAASPHAGAAYLDPQTGEPRRVRGYQQRWADISWRRETGSRFDWELAGEYIRIRSRPTDKIYVWGWVPGIYVAAQRLSPVPKASESAMHTLPPSELAARASEILEAFGREPPKFIVDARKDHFPWNRLPLELWPILVFADGKGIGFLPPEANLPDAFDRAWIQMLTGYFGRQEAERYQALAPLRRYVMENYRVCERERFRPARTRLGFPTLVHETFNMCVIFVRK